MEHILAQNCPLLTAGTPMVAYNVSLMDMHLYNFFMIYDL